MDDKPEIDAVDTDSAVDEIAAFDEVIVWGHENAAETNNVFVRGVDEWVTFAEAVSSHCSTRQISSVWCLVLDAQSRTYGLITQNKISEGPVRVEYALRIAGVLNPAKASGTLWKWSKAATWCLAPFGSAPVSWLCHRVVTLNSSHGFPCCWLQHFRSSRNNRRFVAYPSCAWHRSQTLLNTWLASSFSAFPTCSFSLILPSPPYFLPPLWLAYLLALVIPIWTNFRVMSIPTKSSSSSNSRNLSHNAAEEACAMGTVRKRHKGSKADLYGSNVRTPCSPRPMRYDMRTDSDALLAIGQWLKINTIICSLSWASC